MWGNLRKPFYINTVNGSAVVNMRPDAFLELRCDLDMRGPRPMPVGAMPHGVLALQQTVLDTHELTVEAAVTGDRALLRRAMLTDPLCNNIGDADACIKDLLAAERDGLPSYWYTRGRRA
jgi:alpha-galactosidase/6-phospho-beta-glucosidase family protein